MRFGFPDPYAYFDGNLRCGKRQRGNSGSRGDQHPLDAGFCHQKKVLTFFSLHRLFFIDVGLLLQVRKAHLHPSSRATRPLVHVQA